MCDALIDDVKLKLQHRSSQAAEQQHLKSLSGNVNNMQHVLEEAGRLLKLVWRVSLPAGSTGGDGGNNQQVDVHKLYCI